LIDCKYKHNVWQKIIFNIVTRPWAIALSAFEGFGYCGFGIGVSYFGWLKLNGQKHVIQHTIFPQSTPQSFAVSIAEKTCKRMTISVK
jgi:hypothetical protein